MSRTIGRTATALVLVLFASSVASCSSKSGGGFTATTSAASVGSSATPAAPPSVSTVAVPTSSSTDLIVVGVAAVPITPATWQGLPLAGFGGAITGLNFRYATGVHDDLWARTLVLEKNGTVLVVQSLDLVGVLHLDINPVKRSVEQAIGIPADDIVICSTHVHSGPDPVGIWAGIVDEGLMRRTRDRMVESIVKAWRSRQPARMKSVSVEPVSGFDPQTHELKRGAAVRTGDDLTSHDAGVTSGVYDQFLYQTDMRDPVVRATEIVALQFDDPTTGKTVATLVNWHDHPEVLESSNTLISSDFPHYLRERMEARLGGTCVYVSGTVGNQIGALRGTNVPERDLNGQPVWDPSITGPGGAPFPKLVSAGGITKIRSIGCGIADEAIAALSSASWSRSPKLSVKTEPLYIDLENPAFMLLTLYLQRVRSPYLSPQPNDLAIKGIPGFVSTVGGVKVPITIATLGDAQLVTVPGEVAPEYFLGRKGTVANYGPQWGSWTFPAMPSIRSYMTGRDKIVCGLANSYLGYLIPRTDTLPIWQVNHPNYYEEMVSAGANYGDNVGNKILQMLGAPVRFSTYATRP